ncbi:MAG: YfhO family protein [Chloroflexota bacterium]
MFRKRSPSEKWADLLALFSLVGMIAWFCDGMLFEGKVPFFRDLGTYSYPIKYAVAKSLQAGQLGLWNHNMAAGFPLLAAFQPGAFYPPSWLFALLPFFDAVRWTFFLHFFIAAAGTYCLCRHWQCPVHLSLIGALTFALGGTTVSLSNLLNHFQSAVWLPWVVLYGERFFEAVSWKSFVILIFILLCSLLAGSPEIYVFSMGLLLVDGVRLRVRKRLLLYLLAANLVVAALGMVQFLPTAELLQQSRRDRPIPFQEVSYWSLNPSSLVGLIAPDKEADSSLPLGVRLFFAHDVPFLLSHYLGVMSLLAICAWFYFSSWKERFVVGALTLGSLILAFGNFTPIYGFLFEQVSLFRILRFPEKFFFITFVLLFYIIMQGLGALHRSKDSAPRFPVALLVSLLVGLTGVYAYCRLHPERLAALLIHLSSGQAASGTGATTVASIYVTLERQIGIIITLLMVYYCASKAFLRAGLQHLFLIFIVLFDLGTAHKPLQFLLDPAIVTKSHRVLPNATTESGRLFYYPTGTNLHPSTLTVMGWPSYPKATALSFENLLPNAGVLYGFEYFQEIDALTRQPYNDFLNFANFLPPEKRVPLLRALNIRYVIAFQPLDLPGMHLIKQFPQNFSWLYEVENPVPRVYVATQAVYEPQVAKTLRLLSDTDFDLRQKVLVDEKIVVDSNKRSDSEVKIVRYANSDVVIQATLAGSGVLVLTDSYYPGWKVFIDGKEGSILRANHFFRGVQLSPGTHRVEFRYEPLSFRIGLAISLISLLTLTAISLGLVYVRRKRRVHELHAVSSHQPLAVEQE